MSKYKTPIRIQLDVTKKINQKTNKYRLPFQKQQTTRHSIHRTESKAIDISQQIKIDDHNEKQSLIEKQAEQQYKNLQVGSILAKHEQKEVINQQQTQSVIVKPTIQKQEHETQKNQNSESIELKSIQKENRQIKVGALIKQSPQIKRVESKLTIDRSHQLTVQPKPIKIELNRSKELIKLKVQPTPSKLQQIQLKQTIKQKVQNKLLKIEPIQTKNTSFQRKSDGIFAERRVKYHSSNNRYADQEHYADASRQSEIDTSTLVNTNPQGMPKIIRKSKQNKPMHQSLKKVERQVWQFLTQTQKQQIDFKSHKKSKSKVKRSKSKLPQSDLKSKTILEKLRDINEQKAEQQVISNTNYDMYDELPPINQDSQISYISKEEHDSILHRLNSLLEQKQSSTKQKKAPLQKYCRQYELISKINPFFKKLNRFAGCILLSIGKIKFLDAADLIFTEGQPITHLSIIILGKVVHTKAFNQHKNFGIPGQSLGQEALFDQSKPYHLRLTSISKSIFYRTQARAHTKLCILRINLRKFYKMSMQLNSIGEKRLFNLIDNLFKINYLRKNALLNQQLKERLQTEIMVTRRKRKGSLYFH